MVIGETALWEERNADKAGCARKNVLAGNDRNPKFGSVEYHIISNYIQMLIWKHGLVLMP